MINEVDVMVFGRGVILVVLWVYFRCCIFGMRLFFVYV